MSRIFYDHIVVLEEIDKEIKQIAETSEERDELWQLVDEIVHHRVLGCILDHLPHEHHEEFLTKLQERPYDIGIMTYLKKKIRENIEDLIKKEVEDLKQELMETMKG